MAAPEYCGIPYRQISKRLRIQRGPGNPDKVNERPMKTNRDGTDRWFDSVDKPTVVVFDEFDQVDVPFLLSIGALAEIEKVEPVEVTNAVEPIKAISPVFDERMEPDPLEDVG